MKPHNKLKERDLPPAESVQIIYAQRKIEKLTSLLDEALRWLEQRQAMGDVSEALRDYRGKRFSELRRKADLPGDKWRD